jgi:hypothetical protein
MTALATTSETLAAQTPSGRSIALWALLGFLGSWVFIRTSSRLIRSPEVDWWPGKRQHVGRAAYPTTWFGGTVLLIVCGSPKPSPAWTACWAIRVNLPERGDCALGGDAPAAAPVRGLLAELRRAPVHTPSTTSGRADRRGHWRPSVGAD